MGTVTCNTQSWATSPLVSHAASYDSWVEKLNMTYGSWSAESLGHNDFSAATRTNQFGAFAITDCVCDPCAAERTPFDMAQDDGEILAIQLVVSGREKMVLGNQEFLLNPGDIFVWDNTQKMKFEVYQKLHKVSAIFPLQRLKEWMPTSWHKIPRKIVSGTPHNTILSSYILSLSNAELDGSRMNDNALSETTVAMLANSMAALNEDEDGSLKFGQLQCIKYYINRHLADPDLSLDVIAQANSISIRYLHWLFSNTGETVSQYIIMQRLERSKRDLANAMMSQKTITQIAYSWGFSGSAHFSKRFKMAYGLSPREYRNETMKTNTTMLG